MSAQLIDELHDAVEGLIGFIAAESPGRSERDAALRGLISLRNQLTVEAANLEEDEKS